MFRYRLHSPDGDDLGEAVHAVLIKPGEEIHSTAAAGNMHSGRHHQSWVNAPSWLFTAALVVLIVTGVVALRRRRRSHNLSGHS
ncbi:MAG TPA: hypothetical protein VJ716_02820 [Gaiellaceae bacterium]|nr:hypothetical protein [Gaiellaceae bacterium]